MNTTTKSLIARIKYKSIYLKFIISSICLTIITSLVVGTFIYIKVSSNLQNEAIKYYRQELDYLKNEIDSEILEISKLSIKYSMDPEVQYFLKNKFSSNPYLVTVLYGKIKSHMLDNKLIGSIYVHYSNHGQIITNTGSMGIEEFYDNKWFDMARAQARDSVLVPTREVIESSVPFMVRKRVISIVRFFSATDERTDGAVVINIDIDMLQNRMSKLKKNNDSQVFLIDSSGNILASSSGKGIGNNISSLTNKKTNSIINKELDNRSDSNYTIDFVGKDNSIISYTNSAYFKLAFLQTIPIQNVKQSILFLSKFIITVIILTTASCLLLVFIITKWIYAPIAYVMDIIQKGKPGGSKVINHKKAYNEMEIIKFELDDISKSIEEHKRENLFLKNEVSQSKDLITKKFFRDLIVGKYSDAETCKKRLDALDWPINGIHFVLIISLDNYSSYKRNYSESEQFSFRNYIVNTAERVLNRNYRSVLLEGNSNEWISIVHISETSDKIQIYNNVRCICDELRQTVANEKGTLSVTIAIGSLCTDITKIMPSYNNALKVLEDRWIKGKNSTLCYIDRTGRQPANPDFLYSLRNERDIIFFLKQNDLDNAKASFKSFINNLTDNNQNDYRTVYNSILLLTASIDKMIYEMGYNAKDVFKSDNQLRQSILLNGYIENETLGDVIEWMDKVFQSITEYISIRRKGRDQLAIQKVVDFIENNYNADISLSNMADRFNFSESNLSKIFKHEVGDNFLEYLNKVRVKKAKLILNDYDANICEVSKQVGYLNVQTFIRVFKKCEGITPGEYRKINNIS